ncbi:MAG: suppressor of fused domain protein [Sphingobacteriales bacterium]|nr:suppressor of fused domain protein [Sphingobacteriales bacterium]MBI3719507.1 suppressor of fused domain protein [Sphingobacteriales bacterium]
MTFDDPRIQEKLKGILGEPDDTVFHSVVPFDFGWDAGGGADVYIYKNHIDGVVYITGDLVGQQQQKSDAGNYELMICHRTDTEWGPDLISNLAFYTLDASLNSGETMDLGGNFILEDSKITALIFDKYSDFKIDNVDYGLMLLIGITEDELSWKNENGGAALIEKLKEHKIYPFTDINRESIF